MRASLRFVINFVFMGVMLIELTPFRAGIYGEQVKLSTTKLRQNKEKKRNSDFWNDNNEYPLYLEGKPSSIYCFPIDWCDVMHDGRKMFAEINTTSVDHFSEREFDHEHATSSTIKLRENEKENKNSTF